MKALIKTQIKQAVAALAAEQAFELSLPGEVQVDFTKDKKFGDFSCNVAMVLAKQAKMAPRDFAHLLINHLPQSDQVTRVEVAGPGFINFFVAQGVSLQVLQTIHQQAERFGLSELGAGKKVMVEFVSANPTGPLHVGHGRGAAYGAVISDLLAAVGYDVHREYYVNDAGRQMHILAVSVWLRYLALNGVACHFPENAYQGEYIKSTAALLQEQKGDVLVRDAVEVEQDLPEAPETAIDELIQRAQRLLGEDYAHLYDLSHGEILKDIKEDLAEFGVHYQEWFSERLLDTNGAFEEAVEFLQNKGLLYQKEGATWFKATDFGDEKDRVIIKENGQKTYFANDIAYHVDKYRRGHEWAIDVLGADHHGYVPRIKAILSAFGHNESDFTAVLVQFASLYRGGEKVQMSTRSGSFVTLRELREEVGNDAARFFYVMRKNEQHMDFDLDLAKSQSNDNPMYYIQYAHARVASVLRQLSEKAWTVDLAGGQQHESLLTESHEVALVDMLGRYPSMVEHAATQFEPHSLVNYLRQLAQAYHAYYNAHQILINDLNLRNARVYLSIAVKQVLANGLGLIGVTAPDSM